MTSSRPYTNSYDSKIKLSVPTKKNASDTENYTVTYDYAGATGGNSTKTSSSAKTTVTKYTFNSWSGQGATAAPITKGTENGTTYYYYTFPKTEAATSNYIATYSQTQTSTYSSVTLPNPTKTGYTFGGWYTESGTKAGAGGASYTPQKSLTLHASWTAKSYKVTLDSNGGNKYDGTTFNVTYNGKYSPLSYFISSAPSKTGYTFGGWYTAKSGGTKITASSTVKTAKDHTLFAHWNACSHPTQQCVKTKGGSQHKYVCTVCGQILKYENHSGGSACKNTKVEILKNTAPNASTVYIKYDTAKKLYSYNSKCTKCGGEYTYVTVNGKYKVGDKPDMKSDYGGEASCSYRTCTKCSGRYTPSWYN